MILPRLSQLFAIGRIHLNSALPILNSSGVNPCASSVTSCVRWASKKASSSKRNLGGKSSGKRLGLKKTHDQHAYENQILVRQKMAFRFYPGQFVKTGRDKTLQAQVAGRVCFSRERWHPSRATPFGKDIAPNMPDEEMQRTFVHVIPEEEVGRFKLVEQI